MNTSTPRKPITILALLVISTLINSTLFADIYLSKEQKSGVPMKTAASEFTCYDRVYGVITGEWPEKSTHEIEAYWKDPRGKQREHTRYQFIARNGETRTWVWLQLHPAEPDIVDRLLMQGSDSSSEFTGEWEVTFFIDGKETKKMKFKVNC